MKTDKQTNRIRLVLYIIVFISLFLVSCTRKTDRDRILGSSVGIKGQYIPVEFLLGEPYQIQLLDSLLIIADRIDSTALVIYNVNDNKLVKKVINIGNGPNEFILPMRLTIDRQKKKSEY